MSETAPSPSDARPDWSDAPPASHAADSVGHEIDALLSESKGQLGSVAVGLKQGISDPNDLVEVGAAANVGAVSNILANIRAIRDGDIPQSPSRARGALGAARSFLKQHRDTLSIPAVEHLESVITACDAAANDRSAQEREEEQLQDKGQALEDALEVQGGVYVYTYPHYWRYPTAEGTRRTYLKIGMTTKDAEVRVRQQARQTGLPEDPLLLRVYQSDERDPRDLEKAFHRLVSAADHVCGETTTGGKEWFETSVEFLDTIAATLNLHTLQAEAGED